MTEKINDVIKEISERNKAHREELIKHIDLLCKRLSKKDEAIEELQYERELVLADLRKGIEEDLRGSSFNLFCGFTPNLLEKAWRWSRHMAIIEKGRTDDGIKEEEHKSYKACFEQAVKMVRDAFFGEFAGRAEFKELWMAWSAGYEFCYIYEGQEIIVLIPTFNANEKDYEYVLGGYRVKYLENEWSSVQICCGLDYRVVAEEFQKWIKRSNKDKR